VSIFELKYFESLFTHSTSVRSHSPSKSSALISSSRINGSELVDRLCLDLMLADPLHLNGSSQAAAWLRSARCGLSFASGSLWMTLQHAPPLPLPRSCLISCIVCVYWAQIYQFLLYMSSFPFPMANYFGEQNDLVTSRLFMAKGLWKKLQACL
jgi:hypothetical protein